MMFYLYISSMWNNFFPIIPAQNGRKGIVYVYWVKMMFAYNVISHTTLYLFISHLIKQVLEGPFFIS